MERGTYVNPPGSRVPLPPELAALETIVAEPWFEIDPSPQGFLEGPAFDRAGNFIATSPPHGQVYKIDTNMKLTTVFDNPKVVVDGAAFHRDGRLFVVCLSGELLVMDNADGDNPVLLCPTCNGNMLSMNDVVFDTEGRLYVTDFIGSIMEPTGGVYRVSADGKTVEPVVIGLVAPNGVSLSPENDALWIGESFRNAVTRIGLMPDGITTPPVGGVCIVYNSPGAHGPDSNKVDSAGNLYQCITGQGRIIVLNNLGIPVANVLVPGRDEGRFLRTTNLAFRPGTREGYITASGEGGAVVFRFEALAEGLPLYSHR